MDVADRLGQIQAQLLGVTLEKVVITFQGPRFTDPSVSSVLRTAVLRGLLSVVS